VSPRELLRMGTVTRTDTADPEPCLSGLAVRIWLVSRCSALTYEDAALLQVAVILHCGIILP